MNPTPAEILAQHLFGVSSHFTLSVILGAANPAAERVSVWPRRHRRGYGGMDFSPATAGSE
jgi:hypothetical protein